jgi:hypothetical protein
MQYRDKAGERQRESTGTEHWDEAQQRLRERLQARDNNSLSSLRRGQVLSFGEWSDFYLENLPRNIPLSTGTGRKNLLRQRIQRKPSREMPPAGMRQCRWGVMQDLLAPRMQYGQKADAGSEPARICCDGEQRLGNGLKKQVVNHLWIAQRQ